MSSCFSDLVTLWSDHDDHFKALALAEGHTADLVLGAPGSILAGVEDHSVPAVETGVKVEGDVAGLVLTTEQVDSEPAGGAHTSRHSGWWVCLGTGNRNNSANSAGEAVWRENRRTDKSEKTLYNIISTIQIKRGKEACAVFTPLPDGP